MAQIVHAARMGDEILHPSLIAEMVSAVAEAVIYAAATAAVAAGLALFNATAATASSADFVAFSAEFAASVARTLLAPGQKIYTANASKIASPAPMIAMMIRRVDVCSLI